MTYPFGLKQPDLNMNAHLVTRHSLAAILALLITLCAHSVQAAGYVVTLDQVGSNVVATGSGAIDLTGLTLSGHSSFGGAIDPSSMFIVTGVNSGTQPFYTGFTGPANFGSGGFQSASSSSGDTVGFTFSGLTVPSGYVSDAPLSDTSTYSGTNFTNLGVTPGIYEWTWGGGTGDRNFTLEIGQAAVPEPATWTAGALLALGLFSYFVRRRHSPSA
jgi:hypothetical protein